MAWAFLPSCPPSVSSFSHTRQLTACAEKEHGGAAGSETDTVPFLLSAGKETLAHYVYNCIIVNSVRAETYENMERSDLDWGRGAGVSEKVFRARSEALQESPQQRGSGIFQAAGPARAKALKRTET